MKTETPRVRDFVRLLRRVVGAAGSMAILFCAVTVTPAAHAQTQVERQVYAAKFVCGFKPGFTPPQEVVIVQPGIHGYRDFEPGSYATALNVFFASGFILSTSVDILVSVPETSSNPAVSRINLGSFTIPAFGAARVDCNDITNAISAQAGGAFPQIADLEVVEGFIYIPRAVDDLVVEAVYSFSSQIGSLGSEPTNGVGIGLGASVHVQNIEPKSYNEIPLLL